MVAELWVGGVCFDGDGFEVNHVYGAAVGGDKKSADVATHDEDWKGSNQMDARKKIVSTKV